VQHKALLTCAFKAPTPTLISQNIHFQANQVLVLVRSLTSKENKFLFQVEVKLLIELSSCFEKKCRFYVKQVLISKRCFTSKQIEFLIEAEVLLPSKSASRFPKTIIITL